MNQRLKIETIATGNELLDGTISDTNTQRLAAFLRPLGLKVHRATVVPDDPALISQVLVQAALRSDIVVVSGGLGPTSDDLTFEVAAKTFGLKQKFSALAWKNVADRLRKIKRKANPSQRKQAMIPEGAQVLMNEQGTAPGLRMEMGDVNFFFFPGVPREYDHLVEKDLLPFLKPKATAIKEYLFIYKVFGWPEAGLNELMKKVKIPADVTVGYRTHLPENHIKLQVVASSEASARKKIAPVDKFLRKNLGEYLFSETAQSFEEAILEKLLKQKVVVAIAESCTGGLASSLLTGVSGSSKALDRAFVTYSNQAKQDLLGVSLATLEKFGAVSEATVKEMASGALQRSSADRAVAITGVAGPTGGTPAKPVGTIWIAVASYAGRKSAVKLRALRLQLPFDRELNQRASAYRALFMLAQMNPV